MILNQYGKPVSRDGLSLSSMQALQAAALEAMARSCDFAHEIQGRVLDHRGDPVFSKLPKIGSTVQVRMPVRFAK
jgi:hypothetical protein